MRPYSLELKHNLQLFQEQQLEELTTMINLGSEFYAQAKVYDCVFYLIAINLRGKDI